MSRTPAFDTMTPMLAARTLRFLLASLVLVSAAYAQEPAKPAANTPPLVRADVEAALGRAQKNDALDANLKSRLVGTYDQALSELKSAEDFRTRAAESANVRKTAPEAEKKLRDESTRIRPAASTKAFDGMGSSAIAQALADAQRSLTDAQAALKKIREEADSRVERRRQIPNLATAARAQLDQLRAAAPPADAAPEELEATRVYNAARAQALDAEINSYTEELATYEIRGSLRVLEEDVAEQKVHDAEQTVAKLADLLVARRQEEAESAAESARHALMDTANVPESVRDRVEKIARRNTDLAESMADAEKSPGARTKKILEEIGAIQLESAHIFEESRKVLKQEAAVGLTDAVGKSLRANRAILPPRRLYADRIKVLEQTIGTVQLEQIALDDERRSVSPEKTERLIADILTASGMAAGTSQERELRTKILEPLFRTQRETLDRRQKDYEAYFSALVNLLDDEKHLLSQRDHFEDYIDQRVLWVASGNPLSTKDLLDAADAFRWFINLKNWNNVAGAALADLRLHPVLGALAALFAVAAVVARPRLVARIRRLSDIAERRAATNYLWTAETLLHTVLLAAYWPLLLAFAGWRLGAVLSDSEFKGPFATALTVVAAIFISLEIPRQIFRPRGLGEVHFEWTPNATAAARRALSWAVPAALPVLLVLATIESQESSAWRESAGRLAFFVLMLVWTALGHQLTRKSAPGVMIYFPLSIPGKRARIQRTLYLLSAGAPLAMAIAAGLGYFDTALRLAVRIHLTLLLIFTVSLCVGLAMRALLLARRRLANEQARKKSIEQREALRNAADAMEPAPAPEAALTELNLSEIDAQTARLTRSAAIIALSVGSWFIWVDFVPALRVLDQITIGQATAPIKSAAKVEEVAGQFSALSTEKSAPPARTGANDTAAAPAANAAAAPAMADDPLLAGKSIVQKVEALTVADVLLAAVVIMLTLSSARNLPGLLEIALLQRLALAPGERYAIKAVMGYVFVLIGGGLVLSILGIQWARMQWLVAGLGLGIGFGLQEIFANFMSGLIILFEQPIRVGDTVTVGGVNGVVTRIRIRATTILDGELKELIVPNKEFVTGKLLNWSLSEPRLRTSISVGVAHGTDTRLVHAILLDLAKKNPDVLADPAPQVSFTQFGDSTLVFELRVSVSGTETLQTCRDALHHAIYEAFQHAGIAIAFPQRDVHILSMPSPGPAQRRALPQDPGPS